MRIGNRIFPYPALNNNLKLSDFKNISTFSMVFDLTDNGDIFRTKNSIILKNARYNLVDCYLQKLLDNNLAEVALIIDCSSSLFRKKYNLSSAGKDITVPIHLLKDEVVVSAYIYTTSSISQYSCENFHEDFKNYSFDLEPYSIIAVDDGIKFKVDIDDKIDDKGSSIFMLIKQDDLDNVIRYENGDKKIKIYLSQENYAYYETLKNENAYNNEFFSMLVIPILTNCINEIQTIVNYEEEYDSIDDIIYNKRWFKSVYFAYEREMKKKLTIDTFKDINSFELSQVVLNYATSMGIKDFCNLIITGLERGDIQ